LTRTSPPQVAFSSGEIDPVLARRFDYQRFQTGLATCHGFLPLPQGGFTRAPGTIFRGTTRNNAFAVFVPFQFSPNDAVVLEFTPGFMRVWRYGALVLSGGVPYELATPYGADDLPRLRFVQSADVIRMVDGAHPMQRLARLALNNWTIGAQVFDTGPFRVQNLTESHTVQASAATGTVTLTASSALFTAAHVGSLMQLRPTDTTTVALWEQSTAVSVGDLRQYSGNIYELVAGTNTGDTPPIHTDGTERTDNVPTKWRFVTDGIGIVRITAVASGTSATATVLRQLHPGVVAAPTYRWAEGAWSDVHGYPSAIEIVDQRLAAAATPSEPRTVWFSAIGDFADFAPGIEADSAFAYAIAGQNSVNQILHLARGRAGLHIFALGEELSTRSDTRGQAIGPTTTQFGLDSSFGSSTAVPIVIDGNPIFITRDNGRVMQIGYDFQTDSNRARALSLPAQHLGAEGFAQIVWQSAPQATAWLRRATGDMAALVYEPAEEVLGWATLTVAGGFVDALAVSPDATGSNDIVYLAVLRAIGETVVRTVETFAPTFGLLTGAQSIATAAHYYCAAAFAPTEPTASFSVPHLAGATVRAWTDLGDFGPIEVPAGGAITLPAPVSQAVIGLFDPTHRARTLDVQAAANDGNTMGRRKRLQPGSGVGLHRTAAGTIAAVERTFTQPDRISTAQQLVAAPVAAALVTAYTGVTRIEVAGGQAEEVAWEVRPVGGAPLTVTAITSNIQEAGR